MTEDTRNFCTNEISPPGRYPEFLEFQSGQGRRAPFFFGEVHVHLAVVKGPDLFSLEVDRRFRGVVISQLSLVTGERAGVLQAALTDAGRMYISFFASKLPRACKEIKGNNKIQLRFMYRGLLCYINLFCWLCSCEVFLKGLTRVTACVFCLQGFQEKRHEPDWPH